MSGAVALRSARRLLRRGLSRQSATGGACRNSARAFATSNPATAAMIKVGDKIPEVTVYEDSPANSVNLAELCRGKRVILFGVPGAFTPACSQTHLPGYISFSEKLRSEGVDEIVCVSVNDPFVTAAWAKAQGAAGKVRILSDVQCELTRAMGLELDLAAVLGNTRCRRFSAVVQDGVIEEINVEPDGKGLTCSIAEVIARKLAEKQQ